MAKAKTVSALEQTASEILGKASPDAESTAAKPADPAPVTGAAPAALYADTATAPPAAVIEPLKPAAPQPVPESQRPAILGQGFGLEEFRARTWRATLSGSQSIANTMDPTFWRHMADLMMGQDRSRGRGDLIRVFKPDTAEFAELLVIEIGKGFVKTRLIRAVEAEHIDLPESCPFITRWNESRRGHDVVRKSDGAVMVGGFQSQRSAAAWILDHLKAMA